MSLRRVGAALFALATGGPAAADIYRCTDADGSVRFQIAACDESAVAENRRLRPDAPPFRFETRPSQKSGGASESFELTGGSHIGVGSWPDAVGIGDVTGDGRADVVMTTTSFSDPVNDYHVFVFAQQADGNLAPPVKFPYNATANRNGLVLNDLNFDGIVDIAVGHADGLTLLLADGNEGFFTSTISAPRGADTLSSLDVDLDGWPDLIGLSWNEGATIYYNDGVGGIASLGYLETQAAGFNDQEAGDLNDDGVVDLAVMSGQRYDVPNLSIHVHDRFGALGAPHSISMGSNELAAGLGLGDFNGDGRTDIALSRAGSSPTHIWLLMQDETGSFPITVASADDAETIEVADLDNNGFDDLVVLHGGAQLGYYLQSSAGLADEVLVPIPFAENFSPQGLALGDINGDGCRDVAIANYNHGLVTLYGSGCILDADADGVVDADDNCPLTANADQADLDDDGAGDACDTDDDNDGVDDVADNCPLIANADQANNDSDGSGDLCDADDDNDTVEDDADNCPLIANPGQENTDGLPDGGDACDTDDDQDGHADDADNCPLIANPDQENTDGLPDGGDACDSDDDQDGHADEADNCPLIANADQANNDGDGSGDLCDHDDDNDTVEDDADNCPLIANPDQENTDGLPDGGDACDTDDDQDGHADTADNCPLIANPDQQNTDGLDDGGDACDTDDDQDGHADGADNCPLIANPDQANNDSDGAGDLCDSDDDNDNVEDSADNCPLIANPNQENTDGLPDGGDACDTDDDQDGHADGVDNCPLVANPDQRNTDGLADGGDACDGDDDEDGHPDGTDNCPLIANPRQEDIDGDGRGNVCDAKQRTVTDAKPAILRVKLAEQDVYGYQLTAFLTDQRTGAPLAGKALEFVSNAGQPLCMSTTDNEGKAVCDASAKVFTVTVKSGYSASFAGDELYRRSSDTVGLASIPGMGE